MPKNTTIHKIVIIGSGPIVIGQAAEFDYAGSQACISLQEEGYEVILINSNPATIMTDTDIADKVYLEPLTLDSVSKILRSELPDAIVPTMGGQTGLNLAVELSNSGILEELNIALLGTSLKTINQAEDREAFKDLMVELNEPIPESKTVYDVQSGLAFANQIGFPVIIRPAFTLGGSGGGIASDEAELTTILKEGLSLSPSTECLVEQSIAGYKEIEFEVMRDSNGSAIIVAGMENFDPVGVHTGDSIVFTPTQTLTDKIYQNLRDAALKIVNALKIEGGCNVQLAQDPNSNQYYIIEVNPRVSRSSALASKATGYPIAKIAAKIAVGLNLDEIINPITKTTYALFEPALDYIVAKIPRFAFDKFPEADNTLGTQMKATGEVMAIGTRLEEALLKAVQSLEVSQSEQVDLLSASSVKKSISEILHDVETPTSNRLFDLFTAISKGASIEQIHQATAIDPFFISKLVHIVNIQKKLLTGMVTAQLILDATKLGFNDTMIRTLTGLTEHNLLKLHEMGDQQLVYKMVDTCAAEFEGQTPYYYQTVGTENESIPVGNSILVIGAGPIRIGQGVEFDYTTVHSVKAIQKAGYKAIIVNNNPETVSTDFSISDKLYFEPLTLDSIMNIVKLEKPLGVIVQFGGQTAINLTQGLVNQGVKILGTSLKGIEETENRHDFEDLLQKESIKHPKGATATTIFEAHQIVSKLGYPLLVRPSFVLGGRGMAVVHNDFELQKFLKPAFAASAGQPILIDQYISGIECEVDILSDGTNVFIPGIMEQIEASGVHSGDSIAVYPPQHLSINQKQQICDTAIKIGQQVHCVGMMNIQFIVADDVYVIEVNPRASRTVPFMSKTTHRHLAQLATQLILEASLEDLALPSGLDTEPEKTYVKAPVFSFSKLPGAPTVLSPEMKSTGEVLGSGNTFASALSKALIDSYGFNPSKSANKVLAVGIPSTLKKELLSSGFEVSEFDFKNKISVDQIAFAISSKDDSELGEELTKFALSHQIPLFTANDTVSVISKLHQKIREVAG